MEQLMNVERAELCGLVRRYVDDTERFRAAKDETASAVDVVNGLRGMILSWMAQRRLGAVVVGVRGCFWFVCRAVDYDGKESVALDRVNVVAESGVMAPPPPTQHGA